METYNKLPLNKKLNLNAFSNMLDLKYLQNSYKIYWFYAIFEEIKNGNKEILYKHLVFRMIAKSWYSLVKYKLHFGYMDQINKIVLYIYEKYNIEQCISEEKLIEKMYELNDQTLNKFVSDFYKYVPYRLLSPFFSELTGVKDAIKNKMILDLSNKDDKSLYRLNKFDQAIKINENWYEYIYNNQIIIEGWILSKLIYFLQTKNSNIPAIPFKIYPPIKRNLNKATNYWKEVIKINNIKDIYTNKEFKSDISIDHFIPWSFVLHDEVWNLIPTAKDINSSKNDKLPQLELYLEKYCDIHYLAYRTALKYNFGKSVLEDYYKLVNNLSLNMDKNYFTDKLKNTIIPIYKIAENQGFMVWGK